LQGGCRGSDSTGSRRPSRRSRRRRPWRPAVDRRGCCSPRGRTVHR
jgi:hypothetical protein